MQSFPDFFGDFPVLAPVCLAPVKSYFSDFM